MKTQLETYEQTMYAIRELDHFMNRDLSLFHFVNCEIIGDAIYSSCMTIVSLFSPIPLSTERLRYKMPQRGNQWTVSCGGEPRPIE
jgi:hypothetical protein